MPPTDDNSTGKLQRDVGVLAAVAMGLGSILGTGVFVSIGIAAGQTGPAVLLAIVVAAAVAAANALSSAQLAANHPVSGGAYEYGYRWLNPRLGFAAGWMFLCAKSASAATAALGLAGYLLQLTDARNAASWLIPIALATVVALTLLVLTGIRRTAAANAAIVAVTVTALLALIASGATVAAQRAEETLLPLFAPVAERHPLSGFLEACALMFVAYTGYGRIATLGEEIQNPRRNIPRAIVATLCISLGLYLGTGFVAVGVVGADALFAATTQQGAPLHLVATHLDRPLVVQMVAVGAVTAMLGVLLNLILGLSRVMLAMGRRGDLPPRLAAVHKETGSPRTAVAATGIVIASLTLIGDITVTWSFSAFTVLVYYALTNLAATRLTAAERLYPAWIPWAGLFACLTLAFWVDVVVWMAGLGVLAAGWGWQTISKAWLRAER